MRKDTITIDGVTLATTEAEKVLAFWDHESGDIPWCLTVNPTECPRTLWLGSRRLTPALVDQLRDHVMPWTEVRRDEVEPGEVYEWFPEPDERIRAVAGSCTCAGRRGLRFRDWCDDFVIDVPEDAAVLVRRPHRPTLTIGEVEPGSLVEMYGFRHRVLVDYNAKQTGHVRAARVDTWETHRWCADTPVELVEDES